MYGAFIGDIVGSIYEYNNIKTKEFPLFSKNCDYTDDSIMTAATAKAIMLSSRERSAGGKRSFKDCLTEVMRDFGRRYPNPTGLYGGRFGHWLVQSEPHPYGSCGNGSAMRVSPCGLAAVTLEEAKVLARASACVTHNHPEGVRGAEATAAAVFLAKTGKTIDEIRAYITENYYDIDFTLDSIRGTYEFDATCQGTVPQSMEAFFESTGFEDAIRNIISIGGDSDTAGAITGSVAWSYYKAQAGGAEDTAMLDIKARADEFLPDELKQLAEEFRVFCLERDEAQLKKGACAPIMSGDEYRIYLENYTTQRNKPASEAQAQAVCDKAAQPEIPAEAWNPDIEKQVEDFCNKYLVLAKLLCEDEELNAWCRKYSAYRKNERFKGVEDAVYDGLMKEAYRMGFMPKALSARPYDSYKYKAALAGSRFDLAYGISFEIRTDYHSNGSLICESLAEGRLYELMKAYLEYGSAK